ncbi:helix-turn-helix domain-containing protein [Micromonospora sp. IBSANI012]|uniref:helix-turn-helix domain-containing protein n=1 Tax=Micromonospora sp. IBSANI012 TaxID=3457761 RepID=UPI0040586A8F
MFQTSELVPRLAECGISLSREQVFRLVTQPPQRLSMDVLAALCDILQCQPNDLIEVQVVNARSGPATGQRRLTPYQRNHGGRGPSLASCSPTPPTPVTFAPTSPPTNSPATPARAHGRSPQLRRRGPAPGHRHPDRPASCHLTQLLTADTLPQLVRRGVPHGASQSPAAAVTGGRQRPVAVGAEAPVPGEHCIRSTSSLPGRAGGPPVPADCVTRRRS